MKLKDLVNARHSLGKLVAQDLPLPTAYALMKMTDTCNRHLEFFGAELQKFDPETDPERLRALEDLEVDDVSRITVQVTDELRLSAADVKMLSSIIDFE